MHEFARYLSECFVSLEDRVGRLEQSLVGSQRTIFGNDRTIEDETIAGADDKQAVVSAGVGPAVNGERFVITQPAAIPKKSAIFPVRLSKVERDAIRQLADESGVSMHRVIRQMIGFCLERR